MSFLQNCKVCFNPERLPITYQSFCHRSLVRPKSKSPNWQGSQPISYKAKFSQRDNIYLADLKYIITYQNIWGKLRSDYFYILKFLKWQKKLPNNLHGWAFYKIAKFVLTKKVYQQLTTISVTKVCSGLKVNWLGSQPINYKANFSQRDKIHLADHTK